MDLPAEWILPPHPCGVISSSDVRNHVGQPIGGVTLSSQEMEASRQAHETNRDRMETQWNQAN